MKRIIALCLVVLLLVPCLTFVVLASETDRVDIFFSTDPNDGFFELTSPAQFIPSSTYRLGFTFGDDSFYYSVDVFDFSFLVDDSELDLGVVEFLDIGGLEFGQVSFISGNVKFREFIDSTGHRYIQLESDLFSDVDLDSVFFSITNDSDVVELGNLRDILEKEGIFDRENFLFPVTQSLHAVTDWVGTIATSLLSGELNPLLLLLAVPIAISLIFLAIKAIKYVFNL